MISMFPFHLYCSRRHFFNWLCELCVNSFFPGACFQRCKTALDFLEMILDSLALCPLRKENKTRCPESFRELASVAHSLGKWTIVHPSTVQILIECIIDGNDEIQQLASDIVVKYLGESIDTDLACDILRSALSLLSSPQARYCQSGALLAVMVFEIFVIPGDYFCEMKWCEEHGFTDVHLEPKEDDLCPVLGFLSQLSVFAESAVEVAKVDVIQAADKIPSHGILLLMDMCIQKTCVSISEKVLPDIVCLCEDVIRNMMTVLSGHTEENAAPSFAEMGVAITKLIGEEQEEEDVALSHDHQKIMSWAWLNLKVSCNLLCTVACKWRDNEMYACDIKQAAFKLLQVQTKCRHKGVIESCSVTIKALCVNLLKSQLVCVREIPGSLLREVLDEVCSERCAFSTTRRSAGLPLLIRSILAAHAAVKQHQVLDSTLSKLFSILDEPLPTKVDATHDVPQVHALHILKAMFRDAGIAHGAQLSLERALVYSIHGFSEPHWSIRNGATTLFGTVLWRMVGQKKSSDMDLKTVTTVEFMTSFPAVLPCIGQYVRQAVVTRSLCPSILPALTLLSQLASSPQIPAHLQMELVSLQEAVASLAAHPMYGVRHLAASALPSLIGQSELWVWLDKLLNLLPLASGEAYLEMNTLHGVLLQLQQLFKSVHQSDLCSAASFVDGLLGRWWLADPAQCCHMVSAEYFSLLIAVNACCSLPVTDTQLSQLWKIILSPQVSLQVCRDIFQNRGVKFVLDHHLKIQGTACGVGASSQMYQQAVVEAIQRGDAECCLAGLHHLMHNKQAIFMAPETSQEFFSELVGLVCRCNNTLDCHKILLQLIYEMWLLCPDLDVTLCSVPVESVLCHLNELLRREAATKLEGFALPVLGIFVNANLSDIVLVRQWCDAMERMSKGDHSSSTRLQAARALTVSATRILTVAHRDVNTYYDSVCSAINGALNLLQDEDTEVRQVASKFVVQVCQVFHITKEENIQANKALELFCGIIVLFCREDFNLLSFTFTKIFSHDNTDVFIYDRSHVLYEAEDINIYAENVKLKEILHKHLKEENMSTIRTDWLQQQSQALEEASATCIQQLSLVKREFCMNSITGDKKIFSHLAGIILSADLLLIWTMDCKLLTNQWISADSSLHRLLKMCDIHPLLKKKKEMYDSIRYDMI